MSECLQLSARFMSHMCTFALQKDQKQSRPSRTALPTLPDHGTSDHGGPNQGQGGLPGHCGRGLSTSARWLRRRPTTTSPSAVTPMLSSALTPSMLLGAARTILTIGLLIAALSGIH